MAIGGLASISSTRANVRYATMAVMTAMTKKVHKMTAQRATRRHGPAAQRAKQRQGPQRASA
eukprot:8568093-Lingulodinium_polyedra.AAC.1